MTHTKYNALPVHYGYAFTPSAAQAASENAATYAALKDACMFGSEPDGTHTVIAHAGTSYARASYRVIDNPHGIDAAHIALFCDHGNLCFGYSACLGKIDVYTD